MDKGELLRLQHRAGVMLDWKGQASYAVCQEILSELLEKTIQAMRADTREHFDYHKGRAQAFEYCRDLAEQIIKEEQRRREYGTR